MAALVEIARAAHPPGSPEHERVRNLLMDRLRALGLEPEVQTTVVTRTRGSTMRAVTVRNIVARLPGTASTGAVLATAHYDGRGISRAAGDDGSGVVTLLEALRALRTGAPLRNDLIVLLTDAEELGLMGARGFVSEHPWMADVRVVLSFEMRGGAGPAMMFETGAQNGWIVRQLKAGDPYAYANSMGYEVYKRLPNDTDFTPFKDAGRQGLNFAGIDRANVYHQAYDAPERFSEATLQHQGYNALGMLRQLGGADLSSVDAPDAVYFTLPLLGLVVYDASWVLPITGGLAALLLLTGVLIFRVGGRVGGVVTGLVLSVSAGAVMWFAGGTALARLAPLHAEYGSLHGSAFHSEGWYVLALALAALALVSALWGVARRRFHADELALGALVVPAAAGVVLGFAAPMAAMNLQIPAGAALLAVLVTALLGPHGTGPVGWTVALLLAVPVVFLMEPLTELVWLSMSFRAAPVLGVLMVTALALLLPALDGLRHPNAWWAPLAALVLGVGSLAVGVLHARPAPERPAPSTLAYAYTYGDSAGFWVTDPLRDTVDLPARAWAVERTGQAFAGTADLTAYGYAAGEVPVAPAPAVAAEAPLVRIENDTTVAGIRHLVLSAQSRVGAERLAIHVPEGTAARVVEFMGVSVSAPEEIRVFEHWGEPDPVVHFRVELPAGAELDLALVEHLLRPAELLGPEPFQRPAHLAPDITRHSDRAMLRLLLRSLSE